MIFWPCCCDKDCSCVGCATLQITGATSHPDYGAELVYVSLAYNRTVIMWDKDNSTDSPFDLLDDPSVCGESYTGYPGTKCKGQSYACCSAHYYDDTPTPTPLIVGDVTFYPPTPEPGTDCFPALSCFYETAVPDIWLTKPEQPTHHYYVDKSGYVWLAIVSYEFVVDLQALRPHWVTIYKSEDAINCQEIVSVGAGTLFTMSEICSGMAPNVTDCSLVTTPVVDLSAATVTLKVYPHATNCCSLESPPFDPCNDDDGLCISNVSCLSCKDGIASSRYVVEIEGYEDNEDPVMCKCSLLNGTYILEQKILPGGIVDSCCFDTCVQMGVECGEPDWQYVRVEICFGTLTDPADPTPDFGVGGRVYLCTLSECNGCSNGPIIEFSASLVALGFDCINIHRMKMRDHGQTACNGPNVNIYLTAI